MKQTPEESFNLAVDEEVKIFNNKMAALSARGTKLGFKLVLATYFCWANEADHVSVAKEFIGIQESMPINE